MPLDVLMKQRGSGGFYFLTGSKGDRRGAKERRRGRLNEKGTSPPFLHRQRQQAGSGKLLQSPFIFSPPFSLLENTELTKKR